MRILNISYALPSQEVSNETLIKELVEKNRENLSSEELVSIETQMRKLFKMSGTVTRYHRGIGERALDFGVKAGKAALKKAGVKPEDVDLLIYAGVARGWIEPATANLFERFFGLYHRRGGDGHPFDRRGR
jgi:3-oxoacyl-[acyl-carrier-protein] synthase III